MLAYWRELAGPDLGEFTYSHMTGRTLAAGAYRVDLPLAVLRALPDLAPERFKEDAFGDYGFLPDATDPDGLPVGLKTGATSPRRVGITCAACHTGLMSDRPVPGAGNSSLRYGDFLLALTDTLADTLDPDAVIYAARRDFGPLSAAEEADVRAFLAAPPPPVARDHRERVAAWGAGRASYHPAGLPARIPPLWLVGPRFMADGAWTDQGERNRYVLWLAGVPGESLRSPDVNRLVRGLGEYLGTLRPPAPHVADRGMALRGAETFKERCAACHDRPGETVFVEQVGTDDKLLREESPFDRLRLRWLGFEGVEVRLWPMVKIPGLQAVGARRLLLHNGSVRSLEDLLAPDRRPPVVAHAGTVFDTRLPGHSNRGHDFGGDLDPAEIAALLIYLRGL